VDFSNVFELTSRRLQLVKLFETESPLSDSTHAIEHRLRLPDLYSLDEGHYPSAARFGRCLRGPSISSQRMLQQETADNRHLWVAIWLYPLRSHREVMAPLSRSVSLGTVKIHCACARPPVLASRKRSHPIRGEVADVHGPQVKPQILPSLLMVGRAPIVGRPETRWSRTALLGEVAIRMP